MMDVCPYASEMCNNKNCPLSSSSYNTPEEDLDDESKCECTCSGCSEEDMGNCAMDI